MTSTSTHQAIYQIVLIGPEVARHQGALRSTVAARAVDLGLNARSSIRFLDARELDKIDPRFPVIAAYFGGPPPSAGDIAAAEDIVARDVFIVVVVPTLDGFTAQVPPCLRNVNGLELDPSDPKLERVARRLYEGLELLRSRRMAFISYRRSESAALAGQLHHEFDARCWQSFLDTHSVDTAVPFQPVLWDRMNDADVLVFLDSPTALESRWVAEELERANQLGMGVLQVIWPKHKRDRRTYFAVPFYLTDEDFVGRNERRPGGRRLKAATIRRILVEVEALRARSIAARRDRLVREFALEVRDAGLRPILQHVDEIDVTGSSGRRYRVYPVVGHVDSWVAHTREGRASGHSAIVLYDPTGLLDARVAHIGWLGTHLPVRTLSSAEVRTWAGTA